MTKESLIEFWEIIEDAPVGMDYWNILLLNEGIDENGFNLKGRCRLVILFPDAYPCEIVENWELTEEEGQRFLEIIDFTDWAVEIHKGISVLTSDPGTLMENLMQFIEYLLEKRYKTN